MLKSFRAFSICGLSLAPEIVPPLVSQPVLTTPLALTAHTSCDDAVTLPLPDSHTVAIDFENDYLDWNSIVGIFPASQELFQTCTQTSALFLLLMVYRDFCSVGNDYSVDNDYATVTTVLKTVNCRLNKAKLMEMS